MSWEIIEGECVEVMQGMKPESVHAVVCDPPYGLEFMGREWDRYRTDDTGTQRHRGERIGGHGGAGVVNTGIAAAGNVIIGAGARPTTHRCTGCGKRDQFRNAHACGDGTKWKLELIDPFAAPPTSLAFENWTRVWALEALRLLKPGGYLVAFGSPRTYHRLTCGLEDAGFDIRDGLAWLHGQGFPKSLSVSKAIDKAAGFPQTDDTGSNTLQAAAWEGWGTALKPALEPLALARKPLCATVAENVQEHGTGGLNIGACRMEDIETDEGRYPPNVVLDATGAVALNEWQPFRFNGDARSFFYTAKASTTEKNAGLAEDNEHPTVKPIALMQWLCRLVTPPDGTVFDPFAGSGTTVLAALREGFSAIGVEQNPEFAELARVRVEEDSPLFRRSTEQGPAAEVAT